MKTMFKTSRLALALAVASLSLLSGCGGGGNESGDRERLYVQPDAITVTSGTPDACAAGASARIHVWGGQPPYKLTNPVPDAMTLSDKTLENSGEGFTIQFLGVCLSTIPVTIEDDMGRLISVTVSNVAGK